ncbi:hypothetical protein N7468_002679 [Penicillium chermesinum]|uniref:FAD dependent oxidoreductase domain-containing protein n=1 Tax=Penicillium chermesinum TaxID=63820 RepID=A0A9W9PIY9_9EURO|nr:uncharacterized protein N7468_002679 [Penicillium chermesinum]KAJ5247696.1 hypothetical protein N7468_002679 [Penicillium chermesinum]
MESEILIVGAGIFGVSTAYHLAKRLPAPSSITLLDRAPPPSGNAASTDINKIIRADYSSPLYMNLAFEAIQAWLHDPLFANAGVYHQTGWIAMGERGRDVVKRIRNNFQSSGRPDPTKDMTEEEVRQGWRGVLKEADFSPFESYYLNPQAGWADAGRALEIMANEAIRLGVQYKVGEARRLILGDGAIRGIETRAGELHVAKKVVLATGAWTSHLMSSLEDDLDLPVEARIESQLTAAGVCVAHFQLSDEELAIYNQLPVYVYGDEEYHPNEQWPLLFGSPEEDQKKIPEGLSRGFIDSIRGRLPQLFRNNRQVDYYRLCWDAITPQQHPLITAHPHPQLANLYLAVGGSFHCWKFLPTIGRYVVNVLDGHTNGPDCDAAWSWKEAGRGRGVHDALIPQKELRDYYQI